MAAAAKRARSARDRLSALPDELRRHILSFLPAQEVVRTTVLSKRWIDLWRAVPGINLNIDDFRKGETECGNKIWERFENFVTNLLVLHNAPCLDVFRLKTVFIPRDSRRNVDAWIRRAIKHNPLVLQLSLGDYDELPHLSASPCRRLKRLELNGYLSLDHSFAEQLHSWFPHLEDLILRQCYHGFSFIQSDKLKNLEIEECENESEGVFVIRAPGLSSLSLDIWPDRYGYGISLDAGNSLVKASIDLPGEWSPRRELKLLGSLFSVTSLEMIGFQSKAVLDEEFDKLPIFNNLRTLSLGTHFDVFYGYEDHYKAHGRFLQKSPNLEKLTLQKWPAVPIELPTLENLRTLILHGCNLEDDFNLLRHCLQCSPNLEKLGLELCELSDRERMIRSEKTYSQSKNLVTFRCPKLKSTEIMYHKDDNIPELVSFLLGVSGRASKNAIILVPSMKE
ncbi:hypothetical protein EJB05_37867, partial [Eragrostis curvula]